MSHTFAIMEERNDIVIYQSEDGLVRMEAMVDSQHETIWATQKAIAALFGKDVSDISRHIRNVYTRGELTEDSTLQKMQIAFSDKPVQYYNLDMIIYSLLHPLPSPQHLRLTPIKTKHLAFSRLSLPIVSYASFRYICTTFAPLGCSVKT